MKDITHHEDFLTQHSISLSPEQTDRLSSPGWMAKINLLTSPSPNTRFGWKKCKKYGLTLQFSSVGACSGGDQASSPA